VYRVTALYCMVLHYTTLYCMMLHSILRYCAATYDTALCCFGIFCLRSGLHRNDPKLHLIAQTLLHLLDVHGALGLAVQAT
jgi:hypothetical protein